MAAFSFTHHVYLFIFLPGGGEEAVEAVTYIKPNTAEPTQDSTKDFTPRVETATGRDKTRESTPRKPIRTEVRSAADLSSTPALGVFSMGFNIHRGDSWPETCTIKNHRVTGRLNKACFHRSKA